jgi:hypothetical protein
MKKFIVYVWLMALGLACESGIANAQEDTSPVNLVDRRGVQVPKDSVILLVSSDQQTVTGYSETMAVPFVLKKVDGVQPIPVVGSGPVGAVRNGHYILAFSGVLGAWDELALSPGDSGEITIGHKSILVRDKAGMNHHFRASWGKWFSHEEILRGDVAKYLKEKGLNSPVEPIKQAQIQLIYLDATKICDLIRNMYAAETESRNLSTAAITLAGQNMISVGGEQRLVDEIENWVKGLDQESVTFASGLRLDPEKVAETGERDRAGNRRRGISGMEGTAFSWPKRMTGDVEGLKKKLEIEESKSLELAKGLSALAESERSHHSDIQLLRESLLRAFRLRLEIQQTEVAQLQQKLKVFEADLRERSKRELDIVSKRINQLLDPKFNWEGQSAGQLKKDATQADLDLELDSRAQTESEQLTDISSPIKSEERVTEKNNNSPITENDNSISVNVSLPMSFRSLERFDSTLRMGNWHSRTLYLSGGDKYKTKLDRIVGYHGIEIHVEIVPLPGKKRGIAKPWLNLELTESDLQNLQHKPLSGIVWKREGDWSTRVVFSDKDFAESFSDAEATIATIKISLERKSGDIVQDEKELHGRWIQTAIESKSDVQKPPQGEESSVEQDVLGLELLPSTGVEYFSTPVFLTIEPRRWTLTVRGNTTAFVAEYDLEARPQRVTLTKVNEDGTMSDVVYQRLVEFREGELYSAVKLLDATRGKLESYDEESAILETYARQKDAVTGQ